MPLRFQRATVGFWPMQPARVARPLARPAHFQLGGVSVRGARPPEGQGTHNGSPPEIGHAAGQKSKETETIVPWCVRVGRRMDQATSRYPARRAGQSFPAEWSA
jgi:hypothetical protein